MRKMYYNAMKFTISWCVLILGIGIRSNFLMMALYAFASCDCFEPMMKAAYACVKLRYWLCTHGLHSNETRRSDCPPPQNAPIGYRIQNIEKDLPM
jgi:hypothetical protein